MGTILTRPTSLAITAVPAFSVQDGPLGGGTVNLLSKTVEGLLYRDTFSTLNLDFWVLSGAGSDSIVGGRWRGASSRTIRLDGVSAPAARNISYAQCLVTRVSDTSAGSFWLRRANEGSVDGYYIGIREGDTQMWEVENAGFTNIDNLGVANADGAERRFNFYVADSVQNSWSEGVARATEVDVVNNGQPGYPALWARDDSSAGQTTDFNDFIYMRDGSMVCTGLSGGQKFKILTSGESIVKTATESGGTATIDWRDGTEVLFAGWPTAIITDSSDVEEERLIGAHYPGSTYVLAAP